MSNGLIVRLLPLTAANIIARDAFWGMAAAFPAAHVADPQPKVVTQTNVAPSGTGIYGIVIDVDLGADTSLDTIALLFTNASAAADLSIWAYTSAAGLPAVGAEVAANLLHDTFRQPFGVAPEIAGRRHGFVTGAAVSRRYLRVILRDTTATNVERLVRIGVLAVGTRVPIASNFELGSGRAIDDQSTVRTLPGGETYAELGARVPRWRATWSNLSEAEYRGLWALLAEVGIGRPVLVIEDTDAVAGQAEAIHYGLIEAIDFSERVQLDKQRIELRVREML